MDSALYYTFSTIAQALAGTIAFLAAVVLFKLQGIDSELREHAEHALNKLGNDEGIGAHFVHAHWGPFVAAIPRESFGVLPGLGSLAGRISALLKDRDKLVATLKLSVPLTLGVIVAAVVALALVPVLKCSLWLSIPALVIGVVAFGYCIFSYRGLIAALWRP
jgi:hypothetical protein